jgi:hypothetical protein
MNVFTKEVMERKWCLLWGIWFSRQVLQGMSLYHRDIMAGENIVNVAREIVGGCIRGRNSSC